MTSTSPTSSESRSDSVYLSAVTIFPLLADQRRRRVLHHLSRRVGRVSLEDLAAQIALWEDTTSKEHVDRIQASLYHGHLPRLVDGGLIRFDPERRTVVRRDALDCVQPYLALAVADDVCTAE